MTDIQELVGALLLVLGSVVVGHFLYPIITGGLKVLTPMEAVIFADAGAAVVVGAWMLVKKP